MRLRVLLAAAVMIASGCGTPDVADPVGPGGRAPSFGTLTTGTAGTRSAVLVLTRTEGYHHDSIEAASRALDGGLRAAGFDDVTITDDPDAITTEGLATVDVVLFLSTTGDVLDSPNEAALERWVTAGGGWVGVHAALDTEYDWPFHETLVGARFASHPAVQEATVHVEDVAHPAMARLPVSWSRTDEWYNTRADPRPNVHVLATVDESTYEGGTMGADHPIAWCHAVGRGQAFVTAMGHTDESWNDAAFVEHVVAGAVAVTLPGSCPKG
jgi:type 1 glutamine amidotransferase